MRWGEIKLGRYLGGFGMRKEGRLFWRGGCVLLFNKQFKKPGICQIEFGQMPGLDKNQIIDL